MLSSKNQVLLRYIISSGKKGLLVTAFVAVAPSDALVGFSTRAPGLA